MKVLVEDSVVTWTSARLADEWRGMLQLRDAKGWRSWDDLPPSYRRNAEILSREVLRRAEQLSLF